MKWAVDAWLSKPPEKSLAALQGVMWLYSREDTKSADIDSILSAVIEKGRELEHGNELLIWSTLVDRSQRIAELEVEQIGPIVYSLPLSWWSAISSELLFNMLEEDDKFDWLLKNPVPWPAAILRKPGELCKAPALQGLRHTGCDPELRVLLSRRMRSRVEAEGTFPGVPYLLDLLDSLDSAFDGRSPRKGRTHPLVGWLAQPLEKWPEFTTNECISGDANVAERIILKESGYFDGISKSPTLD
jgi:hypothetical protein